MAAIKTRLKADLVQAMKARDEVAKSNIRMALASSRQLRRHPAVPWPALSSRGAPGGNGG